MKPDVTFAHEFVDSIPDEVAERILYVCMEYATAIHRCACGCGNQVVTPFSPTDWQLTFDGRTVSLKPSIGNWNFPCQSHYFITKGRVRWTPRWTREEIDAGRALDREAKASEHSSIEGRASRRSPTVWERLRKLWS